MAVSLQSIFQAHFDDFARRRPLADYQREAGRRIRDCRTAALGGQLLSCPHGHVHRFKFRSCLHRSCPQCSGLARERALANWNQRLLDTAHTHLIFTVPHELDLLWLYNKQRFGNLLFRAATQTLLELLADVMTKFRGKLRALLLKELAAGRLVLPPDTRPTAVRNLLNRLGRSVWNVKLLGPYKHGRAVVKYLTRYLRGGPIANERLLDLRDGRVFFTYREHRAADPGQARGPRKTTSLAVDEFLARILEHVPPPGMQTVRGYGLYANSKRPQLAVAREHFSQPPIPPHVQRSWRDLCVQAGKPDEAHCPVCGAGLVVRCHFERGRGPPAWLLPQDNDQRTA